jgi:hypothetical protein
MFDFLWQKHSRFLVTIIFLSAIALWSIGLGWGMASALDRPTSVLKSVDPVPSRFQNGEQEYLENCSSCHIAIPPEVMPTESWKQILENPEDHYGQSLKSMIRITQLLIWDYLNAFSRPLPNREPVPLLIDQSRYFKALHPKVKFSQPVTHKTCIQCHPGVAKYDYRSLTQQWQDAP